MLAQGPILLLGYVISWQTIGTRVSSYFQFLFIHLKLVAPSEVRAQIDIGLAPRRRVLTTVNNPPLTIVGSSNKRQVLMPNTRHRDSGLSVHPMPTD